MKQLNEYDTPLTDSVAVDVFSRNGGDWLDIEKDSQGDYVLSDFSRDLERKLALCRDALKLVTDNYNGQMDCLEEVFADVKQALAQTK